MKFVVKKFCELTNAELYEILRVRSEIFIVEQAMRCQDMDVKDYESQHFYIEEDGKILAYLRAFYTDNSKST